jgi:amino acid adenylation domain-containing protein
MSLRHVDLGGALDADAEARDAARLDAARPFDLEHGPLLRASLLRLAADRHVLLFTTHHIVSDDWSLGVLVREVVRAYAGEALQPLRIQYRDYAAWQNRFLNSAEGQSQGEFWRSRLAGPIPVLDLPCDFPRPPVKTYAGRTVTFTLSPGEAEPLRALVREREASLFSLLLSAVKVLLYRYTGQTDIVVAAPVAGRDNPDFEDQVGFYINTLALRDTIRPDAPFTETLDRITRNTMEALDRQTYPFDRLINELAVERDASRMPLSDVVVVMQNTGAPDLSLPDVAVRPFIEDVDTSKYDLHFAFEERDLALRASIVYNPDLFRRDRAERMADHLRTLLGSIAADPGRAVADLDILTDEERRRIVSGFNPAPGPMAPARTLVDWFEDVVARVPTRPAVSIDDDNGGRRELTYAGLDAAANRLAHMLVARGVGPETFVGLLADRSLEMIVGIVGILKAGGAYVPLDPAYPGERIRFIADDAGAQIVLATRGLAGSIGTTAEVIALDGMIEGQSDPGRPACTVRPDNAAYGIYTSGSTGRPKGVIVTHANATRLFSAAASCFEFSRQDVWTVFHSVAFDFSVWEIWGALLSGGRAVIVPQWTARSPDALLDLLDAEAVTVLSQTPSAFAPLIEAESSVEPRRARALRYVVFGGEALDPGILRPWFDRHGDQSPRLVNMYGITETTVHVTYRPLTRADVDSSGSLIGAPLADLKIHLLDSAGRPAPIGVPGEIHVGGAGLARGYSGRPELTAERFLPDPFVPGARLYRSGDLGRYRGDGDIEYLGRADQQVKIRGFRIEPGEIEAAVMAHPAVQRALVITRPRAAGIELVAYVVAAAGGEPNLPGTLRAFLRTRLPEYMVPAAVVPVPAFPLTPHGKIDRLALPDPDLQRRADGIAANRPLTGMETTVTEVMGALLGKTRVPLNENFFDVGAHSLLLVQAHRAIEGRLGRQFPLIAMYQYPSVGALAAVLDQGTPAPAIDAARAAEAEARAGLRRAAFGARRTGHG